MDHVFLKKINSSIATKARLTFLNDRTIFLIFLNELHNSMASLCSAFFYVKMN